MDSEILEVIDDILFVSHRLRKIHSFEGIIREFNEFLMEFMDIVFVSGLEVNQQNNVDDHTGHVSNGTDELVFFILAPNFFWCNLISALQVALVHDNVGPVSDGHPFEVLVKDVIEVIVYVLSFEKIIVNGRGLSQTHEKENPNERGQKLQVELDTNAVLSEDMVVGPERPALEGRTADFAYITVLKEIHESKLPVGNLE